MTSTRELEDGLPLTAPVQDNGDDDQNNALRKMAIYTLLPLDAAQLEQLEKDLFDANDLIDTPLAKIAARPQYDTVHDIYDHHIQTRSQQTDHHPSYFIVADQMDWKSKGVLFVNLTANTEQRESFIGICRCDLEIATSIKANLDVWNMDWVDFKEMEQCDFGGENFYKNPRYYPSDPTSSAAS